MILCIYKKGEELMKKITFRQFINTYNFRYCYLDERNKEIDDTTIIRIYLPNDDENTRDLWFEFWVYDFCDDIKRNIIERSLSDEVKNSYIDYISYTEPYDKVVTIYLTNVNSLSI